MRRRATIVLHWLNGLLLVLMMSAGPLPILGWPFVTSATLMCALALTCGLAHGPGPALTGWLRHAHPWFSRAMYLVLAITALLTLGALLGRPGPDITHVCFYATSLASLHAVFHLWRHTALNDGALRRITPQALHGLL